MLVARGAVLIAGLAVFFVLSLAACADTSAPGWTYAPPPPASATPVASVPTEVPAIGPSTGPISPPSDQPSEQPSNAPNAQPGGPVVKLAAQNVNFDQASLQVPAGVPFTLEFDNQDAGIPHNVAIKDAMGMEVFKGEIFSGVGTRQYQVPALPKGEYTFICTVHPTMTGTLTAN